MKIVHSPTLRNVNYIRQICQIKIKVLYCLLVYEDTYYMYVKDFSTTGVLNEKLQKIEG